MLKTRKVLQLGEQVIATGADALTPEELAGALIVLAETTDPAKREAWAKRGAAMFRAKSRRPAPADSGDGGGADAKPAARNRHQAARARHDRRGWQMDRRKRTRQPIRAR